MICMSRKAVAFLSTFTNEVVLSGLIMYLGMVFHVCLLGERVATMRKRASVRSLRTVSPYVIRKFTERSANHIAIVSLFALIDILGTRYF